MLLTIAVFFLQNGWHFRRDMFSMFSNVWISKISFQKACLQVCK